MRARIILALLGALLWAGSAMAEPAMPSEAVQEKLIKTCLLTLNDANITGNYTVLHAKLAKPFRTQFSPDKLKQGFSTFAEKQIDLSIIAIKTPVAATPTKIDNRGVLQLRGYFETQPSRVHYELDFLVSEEEWKPLSINVRVRPASEN
ncbi:hypothetical protein [Pseudolabrys sp. FHR47]|uniref:hypothetical protein n=1 Tax=Pseudolabrys sp. FHR47 TaxID=2562284 RepID=UPI0010BEAF0A|nr:hypothetical protein [Pseudolabrys sp. FHR47]